MEDNIVGRWVLVSDRLPLLPSLKCTMTEQGCFGVAAYLDDEWVQFLPTFIGDVFKWYEFYNDRGREVGILEHDPSPVLCDGA